MKDHETPSSGRTSTIPPQVSTKVIVGSKVVSPPSASTRVVEYRISSRAERALNVGSGEVLARSAKSGS